MPLLYILYRKMRSCTTKNLKRSDFMNRYELTEEEKLQRLKIIEEIMKNENPQPRNRAERRKILKNRKKSDKYYS